MSASYFDLFAAEVVPVEFRAMQRARARYVAALIAAIDQADGNVPDLAQLERASNVAETMCRAEFKRTHHQWMARTILAVRTEQKAAKR